MKKQRTVLECEINKKFKEIKRNKSKISAIKRNLYQNKMLSGDVQKILNGIKPLEDLDLNLLCLITKSIYNATGEEVINPNRYFDDYELKMANKYEGFTKEESIMFPLKIENTLMLSSEDYVTVMSIQEIVKLYNANLLFYNYETQREVKFKCKDDKIIKVPNINSKSVKEIEQALLNNNFYPDNGIVLNVLAGSGDGNDNEIMYDAKNKTLIINESEIDILDGFHRISAFVSLLEKNSEYQFNIAVAIKNYPIRKAQSFVGQVNTVNKIDIAHLCALKSDRYSDFIVKEIQRESDLKGRVSQTSKITVLNQALVSYNVLADTIDEVYNINNKVEAIKIAEHLAKCFDYLLGCYSDEFKVNIGFTKEHSLLNNNNMFVGYIILFNKIYNMNLPLTTIKEVLSGINFDKNNPFWQEIGVLDGNKNVTRTAKNAVKKFFKEILKTS